VFTSSEFAAFLADRRARPVEEARRLEELWLRAGRVVAVRPDLFAVVAEGRDPARFQPMSSLVATKMAPDAVVSHHAALDFWGISCSMWFDAVYSATDPVAPFVYGSMCYRGVRFPQRLIRSGQQHFGVVERSYADGTVRVTTITPWRHEYGHDLFTDISHDDCYNSPGFPCAGTAEQDGQQGVRYRAG